MTVGGGGVAGPAGRGGPDPCLVLASGSPRRREILTQLGLQFEVAVAGVDEAAIPFAHARELAIKAAFAKACAAEAGRRDAVIVAADTVVALDDRVYPKPADEADARRILRELSGRTHSVITGLAVKEAGRAALLDAAETRVTFRELSDGDIADYVATGEPMDKAGAYGVQGLGGALVARIEGDFLNVVGLPVDLLLRMMAGFADVSAARRRAPEVYRTWSRNTAA